MTLKEAYDELMELPKDEFDAFYDSLPERTKFGIDSGMVDLHQTMCEWWQSRNP